MHGRSSSFLSTFNELCCRIVIRGSGVERAFYLVFEYLEDYDLLLKGAFYLAFEYLDDCDLLL